jgi:acyl-CoA synthetase (AMP-forming)/AMP-acid ligase II
MSFTLGQMLNMSAHKYPAKEAIIFNKENKRLTYQMLEERANRLANALLGLGLQKGDRCAILSYNRSEWAEIYFGLAKTGIIAVPISFRFTMSEIEYVLGNSEPKALIYEEVFAPLIEQIRPNVKVENYLCLGKDNDLDYEDCLAKASTQPPGIRVIETDPFAITYTSGTTGFPKGAVVPHNNLIEHLLIFFKEYGNVGHKDRMLLIMPIFHANSTWFLQGLVMSGGTAVIHHSGGFNPEEILEVIDREKITITSVVPTMLTMILNLPEECKQKYDVSSLKRFLVGSAPLMTKTKEEIIEFFNGAELYEGYGSTETGVVAVLPPEDQLRKIRSIGLPTIGKDVCLLGEDGNEVEQGEIGELYTKGLGIVLKEYWKNPQATVEAFRGDWITVGDMARVDEEGYLYLEDRKKDMIISGGENLYPTEVENVLIKHPAVLEAVVIGIPDELWGEKVHAVVVVKDGMQVTEQELKDFAKDQLAGYKRPKSYDFVKELPKSATGKILRRKVKEPYWG